MFTMELNFADGGPIELYTDMTAEDIEQVRTSWRGIEGAPTITVHTQTPEMLEATKRLYAGLAGSAMD